MKRYCVLTADKNIDSSYTSMIFFEKISDIEFATQTYTTTYISFSSWKGEIEHNIKHNVKFASVWTRNIYEFLTFIEEEE